MDTETLVLPSGQKFMCFVVQFHENFRFWYQTGNVPEKVYAVIWPFLEISSLKSLITALLPYREGLLVSFTRIMTDEAVSSWRLDIHKCILRNCERLIELCVLKLDDEWFPMLDLLALVLNPTNKFHIYNASRHPEFPIDEPFAR